MTSVGELSIGIKKLEILVCGYEIISTPNGDEITETREVEAEEFIIDLSDGFVTTGGFDCPITSINLFKDALGTDPLTDEMFTID